jgi:hypothetical protein
LARPGQPGDQKISAGCQRIGCNKVALSTIAEQRQEIGNKAVDRLDDPREIEKGKKGGDLHGRPGVHFFKVIAERLRDDAAGLADALDHVNEAEEQREPLDLVAVSWRGGGFQWLGLRLD